MAIAIICYSVMGLSKEKLKVNPLATTTNWRFCMPIYEFCAENVTYLEKAFQAGA